MAIYINGTTGISGVDGSAGTPAVQGTDTNTGVFYPAADTVGVSTGGSERMRVDSSGNVGIGTSSPNAASKLEVSNGSAAANCKIRISNSGTYGAYIESVTSNKTFQFGGVDSTNGFASGAYGVYDATVGAWRMVIDSSGNLLVGKTATSVGTAGFEANATGMSATNSGAEAANFNRNTSDGTIVIFRRSSSGVGTISVTTTATAYNTSSDYRLKHDIAPMTGALSKVSALNPVTYKWNADDSDGEGFIAHELAKVVPQCVTGEKDAVDAEGNPVYQGIDTSFLVATLTAAIQEQQALITALTARIEALEAK